MRMAPLPVLFLAAASALLGSTLTDPYVEVIFGGSGYPDPGVGHSLGRKTGTTYVSDSRVSGPGVAANYELSGAASFGTLRAYSRQWGDMPEGESRARFAVALFWDRLMLTVPGATETTYSWQPTVRLSGSIDWTGSGPFTAEPAIAEVAQSVRVEGQTNFTHYPHQVDLFAEGEHDNIYVLPEVTVPANEWFNYRLLLVAQTRLRDGETTDVTSDFMNTLDVVGLTIRDGAGNAVPSRVEAASGALYSPDGITPTPEPASLILVGLAGATLAFARARRSC